MLEGKEVLIVSSNQLMCLGLRTILMECFSPGDITIAAGISTGELDRSTDYVFMHPDTYALNQERFQDLRSKIIILADHEPPERTSLPAALNVTRSESEIVEQLQRIFSLDSMHRSLHKQGNLSSREIEVLKLVARGHANKQIADSLSISMHTVISHRKNITRKLGIKTVSGLTMYAVLNGLISSKDIR